MSTLLEAISRTPATALERPFPSVELSLLAQRESWRKEIHRPLYHIHKWWATRLGSVFRALVLGALSPETTQLWDAFYERHTLRDKIVLDPFMGSGTTLGEGLKLGAKVIGCDINPISTFLVQQALTRVPESDLRAALEKLDRQVGSDIRKYYQTRDPETSAELPVLYAFWVKEVVTPDGESIPLFDNYVFARDAYPKRKPLAHIVCPNCWTVLSARYDTLTLACSRCDARFNPQRGPAAGQYVTSSKGRRYKIKELVAAGDAPPRHRLYAILARRPDGSKIYLPATDDDRARYADAERRLRSEILPLPTQVVRPGYNTNQARGYNYNRWRDFFNARQLLCLGLLLRGIMTIQDRAVQEQLLCLFSGTLEFNNLFCSYKGEGTGAVRHMFSHHILKPERTVLENSVWGSEKTSGTFRALFESRLMRAKRYLDNPFDLILDREAIGSPETTRKVTVSEALRPHKVASFNELLLARGGTLILNGDSATLPIPDCSVDAVVTDPPYFDFVHYSELSDFFFAWLSPVIGARYAYFDRDNSSDVGEVQDRDARAYSHRLSLVFAECARVMKDEAPLVFTFHHSREEGWAAIYSALRAAGLVVIAAHPVHAEMTVASPKSAAQDPITIDAILVCRKHAKTNGRSHDIAGGIAAVAAKVREFSESGMGVQGADRFVLAASQMLIASSHEDLTFDAMRARLASLRVALELEWQNDIALRLPL